MAWLISTLILICSSPLAHGSTHWLKGWNWQLNEADHSPHLYTLLPRDQTLGPDRTQWIQIITRINLVAPSEMHESFIARTPESELIHIMRWGDRRWARILNGSHRILDYAVSPNGAIVALTDENKAVIFEPAQWTSSPFSTVFRRGLSAWAYVTIGSLAAAFAYQGIPYELLESWQAVATLVGMSSAASALSIGLFAANNFGNLNIEPEAFRIVPGEADTLREGIILAMSQNILPSKNELSEFYNVSCKMLFDPRPRTKPEPKRGGLKITIGPGSPLMPLEKRQAQPLAF